MLQLVFRHDYVLGYQIRASIVFYQKTGRDYFLEWLKKNLQFGYIRQRNDNMSEYTIVGAEAVSNILKLLKPYLRLKNKQVNLALKVLSKMPGKGNKITPKELFKLSRLVDGFADLNYSKKRTNTSKKVEEFLRSHNLL
ncbi:MAG: LAGLIDADG family homing endonuclease [Patescibacteria group bacterium]